MITEERVQEFKDSRIAEAIKRCKEGDSQPSCKVLVSYKGQVGEESIPVQDYFGNETAKQILFGEMLPTLFKRFEGIGYEFICISFTSEAWMWKFDGIKVEDIPKDRSHLPKEEILMVTFEGANWGELAQHVINRENNKITDVVHKLTIKDEEGTENLSGRMGNLLRRYNKSKNEHKNTNS